MRTRGFHTSSRTLFLVLALTLACVSAASATTWTPGAETTYSQASWGSSTPGTAVTLLLNDYVLLYPNVFEIGSAGGFNIDFTNAASLQAFMPQTGPVGVLVSNLLNPTSSSAGGFAGDVAALKLDVDFSAAGFLPGTSGIPFGNLVLANTTFASVNGLTVAQFLADANTCLGGGACLLSPVNMDFIANQLGGSFALGPDAFAQNNLVAPSGAPVPEPSTLLLLGTGLLSFGFLRRRFLHT